MKNLNPYLVLGIGVAVGVIISYFYKKYKTTETEVPAKPEGFKISENESPIPTNRSLVTQTNVPQDHLQSMVAGTLAGQTKSSMRVGGGVAKGQ